MGMDRADRHLLRAAISKMETARPMAGSRPPALPTAPAQVVTSHAASHPGSHEPTCNSATSRSFRASLPGSRQPGLPAYATTPLPGSQPNNNWVLLCSWRLCLSLGAAIKLSHATGHRRPRRRKMCGRFQPLRASFVTLSCHTRALPCPTSNLISAAAFVLCTC